jgi:predicted transcriptional regulator
VRSGKLLSVYLPDELSERLAQSAERNHRTKTVQVILALTAFLDAEEAAARAASTPGLTGKQHREQPQPEES